MPSGRCRRALSRDLQTAIPHCCLMVSGLVRILHQRLGYHMTKVTYIFYCGYILPTDIYLYIYGYTINQLIPPLYWFSIAHKSSPLHVLLSSNLDRQLEGTVSWPAIERPILLEFC